MKKIILAVAAFLVMSPVAAVAHHTHKSEKDIVDTAVSAKVFNTLVAAVQAADLVAALKSDGPFTVFAPTDKAFSKLSAGTVESLLKPENKQKLINILKYHVVAGDVKAADVVKLSSAKTLLGQKVKIKVKNGKVYLNGKTRVVQTDIAAKNGTIHVIDSVLIPSAKKDIVGTAVSANIFKTLVAAVQAADLVKTLQSDGPFTVLAPTDDAFKKLPAGTVETLLKPENKDMLVKILTYHVIAGDVRAAQVVKLNEAKTVQGQTIKIKVKNGKVKFNNANLLKADIEASNGTIHVIDTVLIPGK